MQRYYEESNVPNYSTEVKASYSRPRAPRWTLIRGMMFSSEIQHS